VRIAYADPPYLGCAAKLYGHLHPDAAEYDRIETHARLIERLSDEHDAWALSLSTPSLQALLAVCPTDVRVGAWVKPFCSFKPGVNPAYAWEPLIYRGARKKRGREAMTVRDWVACGITRQRGLTGAKPAAVCHWMFELLGARRDDTFTDVFPGSGAVQRAWEQWRDQGSLLSDSVA